KQTVGGVDDLSRFTLEGSLSEAGFKQDSYSPPRLIYTTGRAEVFEFLARDPVSGPAQHPNPLVVVPNECGHEPVSILYLTSPVEDTPIAVMSLGESPSEGSKCFQLRLNAAVHPG